MIPRSKRKVQRFEEGHPFGAFFGFYKVIGLSRTPTMFPQISFTQNDAETWLFKYAEYQRRQQN